MRLIIVLYPLHFISGSVADRINPITLLKSADNIAFNEAHNIPDENWLFTSVIINFILTVSLWRRPFENETIQNTVFPCHLSTYLWDMCALKWSVVFMQDNTSSHMPKVNREF